MISIAFNSDNTEGLDQRYFVSNEITIEVEDCVDLTSVRTDEDNGCPVFSCSVVSYLGLLRHVAHHAYQVLPLICYHS